MSEIVELLRQLVAIDSINPDLVPGGTGEEKIARFNQVVVKNTARYNIPLWDFGTPMNSLPNFGLDTDGVHPSIPAGGIKGAGDFRAASCTAAIPFHH